MYVYIYIYIYIVSVYIYIYIYRERDIQTHSCVHLIPGFHQGGAIRMAWPWAWGHKYTANLGTLLRFWISEGLTQA